MQIELVETEFKSRDFWISNPGYQPKETPAACLRFTMMIPCLHHSGMLPSEFVSLFCSSPYLKPQIVLWLTQLSLLVIS